MNDNSLLKFGAIDIGSNAARLLIASFNPNKPDEVPNKTLLLRVPLRLGKDVFASGVISPEKEKNLIRMMKACKHLLKIYNVIDYRVYATSAMRDAKNGEEIRKSIVTKTGLNAEIIDGKEEGSIVIDSHIIKSISKNKRYIYVDVGGGSTEITLIEKKKKKASKSFNIGTLRLLENGVSEGEWNRMQEWVKSLQPQEIIGAGGNINKIAKILKVKTININNLENLYSKLNKLSVEERMSKYSLKADRADVIVPAAKIFMYIAKNASVNKIKVPTVGLVDGIAYSLYVNHLNVKKLKSI